MKPVSGKPPRFWIALAGIAALGMGVRVAWVLAGTWQPGGLAVDSFFYHELANLLADGHGFSSPASFRAGELEPTADKPPLFPLVLALASKAGVTGVEGHRLVGCLLAAGTIVLTGLLGRRVATPGAGLAAAALVAVNPFFVSLDGGLLTEALYGPLLLASLLAAYGLSDSPGWRRAAATGAIVGAAALVRPEALLLLVVVVLPLLLRSRVPPRSRILCFGVACLAAIVVIVPWTLRNLVVFDRVVPISSQAGVTIGGANCDPTYSGADLGFWRLDCIPPRVRRMENEAERAAEAQRLGIAYAGDHAGRLPVVLAVRALRTWDLYDPFGATYPGGLRAPPAARLAGYGLLLALAVMGLVLLRRRSVSLVVLLGPAAIATFVSLVGFGYARFRYAAELTLMVPAGVALVSAAHARRRR